MKTQIVLLSAVIFFINPSFPGKSLESGSMTITKTLDPGFAFFRTHRQGKGITATWGLTSTIGVAGFVVQRTYNDPSDPYADWQEVSSMSCSPLRSFKCTDLNVFPGYINYRVVAMMDDGNTIVSEVSTVRIVRH
jgi:hypothetical protein